VLRAHTDTSYDNGGRVYESRSYEVDPQSDSSTDYLPTNYWYDPAGQLIKSATGKMSSGSTVTGCWLAQDYACDNQGRQVMAYTCYDTDEINYDDADDLVGDTVVQHSRLQ